MSIVKDVPALSKRITNMRKSKQFPVVLVVSNMKPNTIYDFKHNGVGMNQFIKPFGGNLGDPIIANPNGQTMICYYLGVDYDQNYMTQTPATNNSAEGGISSTAGVPSSAAGTAFAYNAAVASPVSTPNDTMTQFHNFSLTDPSGVVSEIQYPMLIKTV